MKIQFPREYLSLSELPDRWKIRRESWELENAIIQGFLKPCVLIDGESLQRAELTPASPAGLSPITTEGAPTTELVSGWYFPVLGRQKGAYEAVYVAVSDHPDENTEGASIFLLEKPITLTYVMQSGIALMPHIEAIELERAGITADDLATKERDSLLKLAAVLMYEYAGLHDPYSRSPLPSEISKAASKLGIKISDGTVLKFARLAFDECKPKLIEDAQPENV